MTFEITVHSLEEITKIAPILLENQIDKIHLTDKNGMADNLYSSELITQELAANFQAQTNPEAAEYTDFNEIMKSVLPQKSGGLDSLEEAEESSQNDENTDLNTNQEQVEALSQTVESKPIYDEIKLQIKTNYALHNHTNKVPARILANFDEYVLQAIQTKIPEILIISGNPKPKFDSLLAIQRLHDLKQNNPDYSQIDQNLKIGVAFNPFLYGKELEQEKIRLRQKLELGLVSNIYLQIGSSIESLQKGIDFLKNEFPQIKIVGSLLIPTQEFLTRFQFRPWKGVVLDSDYLENLFLAEKTTAEILEIFNKNGIEPLVQIFPFKTKTVQEFKAKYL